MHIFLYIVAMLVLGAGGWWLGNFGIGLVVIGTMMLAAAFLSWVTYYDGQ